MNILLAAEVVNIHWYLPPLLIAMSLVYSATRYEGWGLIIADAVRWALYTLSFLGLVYVLMWLITLDLPTWIYWVIGAVFIYYMVKPAPKPQTESANNEAGTADKSSHAAPASSS